MTSSSKRKHFIIDVHIKNMLLPKELWREQCIVSTSVYILLLHSGYENTGNTLMKRERERET